MNKKESAIQISVPRNLKRDLGAIAVMLAKDVSELDREAYIIGAKELVEAYRDGQRGKSKGNHNIKKGGSTI